MSMSQLHSIACLTNLIMKREVYIFDSISITMSNLYGNILDGMAYNTNAITPTDHMSVAVEMASQLTTSGAVNENPIGILVRTFVNTDTHKRQGTFHYQLTQQCSIMSSSTNKDGFT